MDRFESFFEKRMKSFGELMPLFKINHATFQNLQSVLLSKSPASPLALYVHIPFCDSFCAFCGYSKCLHTAAAETAYVDALLNQIQALSTYPYIQKSILKSVYFGGGTPTMLAPGNLLKLLHRINSKLNVAADCEITLESTISALQNHQVPALVQSGVNRISLGVQSFNTIVRRRAGRKSTRAKVLKTIQSVLQSGINNLCVDLMYNLPGQQFKSWKADLDVVANSGITGCSMYELVPMPGSNLVLNNHYSPIETDKAFGFFSYAENILLGIDHWETFTPVQYGHKSTGRAHYISHQASSFDLIALGPSAVGKFSEYNYQHPLQLQSYMATPETNPFEQARVFEFQHVDKITPWLTLCRLNKAKKSIFLHADAHFPGKIQNLVKAGYVTAQGDFYKLTQKGRFWSVNILAFALKADQ